MMQNSNTPHDLSVHYDVDPGRVTASASAQQHLLAQQGAAAQQAAYRQESAAQQAVTAQRLIAAQHASMGNLGR
ncbi:hypothetical protein GCM10010435_40000 [Winogradskya consettensis]|uniref:Uncharacterized protein n=1 Tax=Winogradskya consettensis TaxID=113560 RepID=A0A919SD20_9ACTN|nr:hypothetical protein [Actinoplanes consettensis]GIM69616.1 hypothetical protein Aco04nite_16130 [Actinoplanes consettensis]